MPDFVNEDDIIILGERDIFFSRERWREIAPSIGFHESPHEMKREIADLLINHLGTSNGQAKARHRTALKKLVKLLEKLQSQISNLQYELSSDGILSQVKGLVEHAKIVKSTAETELTSTSKGGRPRKDTRNQLAHGLLDIYAKYTGNPIRLSRDTYNQPSGPCYRFLSAIFKALGFSITGLARVIEQKRDMLKTTSQKRS